MNEATTTEVSDTIAHCRSTLRWLVIVEILLTAFSGAVSFLQTPFLPPALQQFERESFSSFGIRELLLLCLAAPLLILSLIAWIALLRGWRSGRTLYTIVWLAVAPLMLLLGPRVASALLSTVDAATSVIGGIILGLLYFSDIRRLYEPPGGT